MTIRGKLLGIDHGITRIGIAVSDPMGISARAVRVIIRRSRQEDFQVINRLAAAENVTAIVIGIPFTEAPDGVHTQADTVRLWIQRLTETTTLPVIEWDEQLTSEDARELARSLGRKPADAIDDLAAQIILQSYLDAVHDGLATFPQDE